MDAATHLLVPYGAALVALGAWRTAADKEKAGLALTFGVAGYAPDLDVLFDWLSQPVPVLHFLQHRGASHSLLGAPIIALLFAASLALLASRFPARLGLFTWLRWTPIAAVLGSWTHLVLDGLTYGGVPALWPFATGRAMVPVFHWLVWWMFPLSAGVLALHAFWRLDRRGIVAAATVAVALLVVVAGVRLALRPEAPEGGFVLPRSAMTEWTVLRPTSGGGWNATLVHTPTFGEPWTSTSAEYHSDVPPSAHPAVLLAAATSDHAGYTMGRFGPEVVTATPLAEGGWNVSFVAVAQRFEAMNDPSWTPSRPHEAWGLLSIHVQPDGSSVPAHRGW